MEAENWSFAKMLATQAKRSPDKTALIFRGAETSYGELQSRANSIAQALIEVGVKPGGRIAILDLNSDTYVAVFYGAALARATTVGINSRLAPPEVAFIVNDAGAEVLFVGPDHVALVEEIETSLSTVTRIVAIAGGHDRWPSLTTWLQNQPDEAPQLEYQQTDDVIQLYTSGTTGHPKGVCHGNRQYAELIKASRAATWGEFDTETVMLVAMPLFHVAGFNLCNLVLNEGGTCVITQQVDPDEILEFVPRFRITDTLFVPAVILALVNHPKAPTTDFSSFRNISYGAAPIAASLLDQARALFQCRFTHLYGLTESLGAGTYLPPDMHDEALGKLRSVGVPYPGSELRIVDGAGNRCAQGEVGEIIMRSSWIMRCYWKRDSATEQTVVSGWLHSGDAGYMDEDGYVYIHDRVKDMIVSGGENVYPAEVESALFEHPAIADVAVIGIPDDKWGEAVKAVVVLKPDAQLSEAELIAFARQRIAGFKIPRSMDIIDELPRNASGKVLKRTLRDPYWAGHQRRVN